MTNLNFLKSLSNVLINEELRVKTLIGKDFKTKAIYRNTKRF